MKSKIDKVIELVQKLNFNMFLRHHIETKEEIILLLEQLRPYVELGELVSRAKIGIEEWNNIDKLFQQIKEQRNDNNIDNN